MVCVCVCVCSHAHADVGAGRGHISCSRQLADVADRDREWGGVWVGDRHEATFMLKAGSHLLKCCAVTCYESIVLYEKKSLRLF